VLGICPVTAWSVTIPRASRGHSGDGEAGGGGSGETMIVQLDQRAEDVLATRRHAPTACGGDLGEEAAEMQTLQQSRHFACLSAALIRTGLFFALHHLHHALRRIHVFPVDLINSPGFIE
jgi:hypothetical protein